MVIIQHIHTRRQYQSAVASTKLAIKRIPVQLYGNQNIHIQYIMHIQSHDDIGIPFASYMTVELSFFFIMKQSVWEYSYIGEPTQHKNTTQTYPHSM